MKAKIFYLTKMLVSAACLFVLVLMFSSCATQKITSTPETKIEKQIEVPAPKPIVWKQSEFPAITLKDSVLFFNSAEIRLEGAFFNKTYLVKNGIVNLIDSTNSVSKTVPALTSGGWIEPMKKDKNGNIGIMVISFSQEKTDYVFSFFRTENGSFTLNGKAEIIYNGKRYPVVASTIGGNCILMFYLNKTEVRNEIKDVAPGWQQ